MGSPSDSTLRKLVSASYSVEIFQKIDALGCQRPAVMCDCCSDHKGAAGVYLNDSNTVLICDPDINKGLRTPNRQLITHELAHALYACRKKRMGELPWSVKDDVCTEIVAAFYNNCATFVFGRSPLFLVTRDQRLECAKDSARRSLAQSGKDLYFDYQWTQDDTEQCLFAWESGRIAEGYPDREVE